MRKRREEEQEEKGEGEEGMRQLVQKREVLLLMLWNKLQEKASLHMPTYLMCCPGVG